MVQDSVECEIAFFFVVFYFVGRAFGDLYDHMEMALTLVSETRNIVIQIHEDTSGKIIKLGAV